MAEKKLTNPGKLETPADCAALAAYEWAHEVDREHWNKDRERYIAVRSAQLATRIKPKATAEETPRPDANPH